MKINRRRFLQTSAAVGSVALATRNVLQAAGYQMVISVYIPTREVAVQTTTRAFSAYGKQAALSSNRVSTPVRPVEWATSCAWVKKPDAYGLIFETWAPRF